MRSLPAINTSHEARQIGVSPPSLQAISAIYFVSARTPVKSRIFERPQRTWASHSRGRSRHPEDRPASIARSAPGSRTELRTSPGLPLRHWGWSDRRDYLAYRRALLIWLTPVCALRAGQSNQGSNLAGAISEVLGLVGPARFELATSSSRTRRSTKLSHGPINVLQTGNYLPIGTGSKRFSPAKSRAICRGC